ncbi:hypothetical protein [Lysobacter claricitrinus]|uniref:hypothetical protein n=1 Tax=Lysobacter claricitrinus TaxID=3367728 RepID=UPI0037DAFACB
MQKLAPAIFLLALVALPAHATIPDRGCKHPVRIVHWEQPQFPEAWHGKALAAVIVFGSLDAGGVLSRAEAVGLELVGGSSVIDAPDEFTPLVSAVSGRWRFGPQSGRCLLRLRVPIASPGTGPNNSSKPTPLRGAA